MNCPDLSPPYGMSVYLTSDVGVGERKVGPAVHLKISCVLIGSIFFHRVYIGWFFRWTAGPTVHYGVKSID